MQMASGTPVVAGWRPSTGRRRPVPPLGRVVDKSGPGQGLTQRSAPGAGGLRGVAGGGEAGVRALLGVASTQVPRSSSVPSRTRVRSTAAPHGCGATAGGQTCLPASASTSSGPQSGWAVAICARFSSKHFVATPAAGALRRPAAGRQRAGRVARRAAGPERRRPQSRPGPLGVSVSYPWHSPTVQRWFRVHAEPPVGRRDVLIVHDDITEEIRGHARVQTERVGPPGAVLRSRRSSPPP